jgi:hypothetical protein
LNFIRRLFIGLFYAGACAMAICAHTFAQSVPPDSVIFDSIAVTAGEPAVLTARFNNTRSLISLSLPLTYQPELLVLDSISWVDSRPELQGLGWYQIDGIVGRILLTLTGLYDPYIPAGRGILAKLFFTSAGDAPDGSLARVDTSFFPPNQSFYARDFSLDDSAPYFAAGRVEINEINYAPTIEVAATHSVQEGQQLAFTIVIRDPNDDPLSVSMAGAPNSATLTDQGEGLYRFAWTPDFIGPYSASVSPVSITFYATDGELPQSKTVKIWIGNVNRPPQLAQPAPDPVNARQTVEFSLEAADPDLEPLTIKCLTAPAGYEILGSNPWTFIWPTTNADIGVTTIRFVCEDVAGAGDTIDVAVTVVEFPAYRLGIAETEGTSGQQVRVDVSLHTETSIGAADLLILFDPAALEFTGIDRADHGLASWEFVDVAVNANRIHLVGIAETDNGVPSPPLPPSDTILFSLIFNVSTDVQYHDQFISLSFDLTVATNNLLSDPLGNLIPRNEITFVPGSVLIRRPANFLVGDINLNGLAYEVGDAVRFTNYFIYGQQMALDATQMANSDCNGDGLRATIADLVYLIMVLTED